MVSNLIRADMNLRALLRVIDFFVPVDVFTAVFVVFALENVADYYFSLYIPDGLSGPVWLVIAVIGLALLNLASADAEELDELEDDLEDIN